MNEMRIYDVISSWRERVPKASDLIKDFSIQISNMYSGYKIVFDGYNNEHISYILEYQELDSAVSQYDLVLAVCNMMLVKLEEESKSWQTLE